MTKSVFRAGRSLADRNRSYTSALACALMSTTALASVALPTAATAQTMPATAGAQVRQSIDGNGVDLFHGNLNIDGPALSVGPAGAEGLTFRMVNRGNGFSSNLSASLHLENAVMTVRIGAASDRFTVSGTTYASTEGNGATLTYNGTTKIYTYTSSDGTVARFDKNLTDGTAAHVAQVIDIARPSGERLTYSYQSLDYCRTWKQGGAGTICMTMGKAYRAASVRNSYGYRIAFNYGDYEYQYESETPDAQPIWTLWSTVTGVSAGNLAAPGAAERTQSFATTVSGGVPTFAITDAMGRITSYRGAAGALELRLPGSNNPDVTYASSGGRITSVAAAAGGTTTYSSSDASGVRTVTVTDGVSHPATYRFDIASQRMISFTDAPNRTTSMEYDASGRVTKIIYPELNEIRFTYDARGNVTETRRVARPNSGLADIVTSATYTCVNTVICDLPATTTDARLQVTNYSYDPTHGGLTSVTGPIGPSGVRPQVRYSYTSMQAYYSTGGGIVASGQPVYRLTGSSTCRTQASCSETADEVVTIVEYGPQSAGTGNNLLPVSQTQRGGDNVLSATVALAYDAVGNVTSVDGPLLGTVDTNVMRYNANRELVGTISADPDGDGSRPHLARRNIIDATTGLLTRTDFGTVASQSDTHWANMAVYQATQLEYDTQRRPIRQRLTAGGTTYGINDTSYDQLGRVQCRAVRMNQAAFASGPMPDTACSPDSGTFGPDRITRTSYDGLSRPSQMVTGYGVGGQQAVEATATYTLNGQLETLTDGENNRTTYVYDGHDRLFQTRYPVATVGANASVDPTSSTTGYEQLGYDAGGNVTSVRNRAGDTIGFAFDNLGRMTAVDRPGTDPDSAFQYDLLGRPVAAQETGGGGSTQYLNWSYDALGRQLTESGIGGALAFEYDLAGNRTRIEHPDGFYATYDHDLLGQVTAVRENGATSGAGVLASYGYDSLGRRTSLTRGNGDVSSYSYDAAGRLDIISHELGGTSHDISLTFDYNPAGQIVETLRTNDAYAYTGLANENRTDTHDGRNQVTGSGGTTVAHDARGNTTSDGTRSFSYDSQNRMRTGTAGGTATTLFYDPLGRVSQANEPHARWYANDGAATVYESNGTANPTNRRWVYGADATEPLVEYQGSSPSDRRYLHADERGSVIAMSDSAGTVTAVNRYDEYGAPASTNQGRFQYTGQAWMPSMGLYYYRARMYNPSGPAGGRFTQPDPIGYGAGMNLYAYVGADPVNLRDPFGMAPRSLSECTYLDGRHGPCMLGESDESTSEETVIVTAHRRRHFPGLQANPLSYDHPLGREWIVYGYTDGTFELQGTTETTVTCANGEVVTATSASAPNPSRTLASVSHGHQDLAPAPYTHSPYPGGGDGLVPALRGVTNYQFSSRGVFALRPGARGQVGAIERIEGTHELPAAAEAAIRTNAANAASQPRATRRVC